MGWFGKLAFGYMGLLMGGPLGAVAGAALGHHLFDKKAEYVRGERPTLMQSEQNQAAYFVSMFSILGKMAKIDGVVTKDEVAVVEDFIGNLNTGVTEKQFARQVFNEAMDSRYSIDDFAMQFYQISGAQPTVLVSFLDLLFRIAAADRQFHPAEESALNRIKNIFRINEQQFNSIRAVYLKDVDSEYYRVLNCTPECSDEEIKASYKKLVKEFHPDMIVSKGLPEEFTEFATQRFREIQEAYEKVKQERGL